MYHQHCSTESKKQGLYLAMPLFGALVLFVVMKDF